VIGDVLRRLVNGIVVLLAGLAFFLVPVGGKTAAQHAMAIGASKPAREAATAFASAAMAIADRVKADFASYPHEKPPAEAEKRPAGDSRRAR
jgi:hypothetical protein